MLRDFSYIRAAFQRIAELEGQIRQVKDELQRETNSHAVEYAAQLGFEVGQVYMNDKRTERYEITRDNISANPDYPYSRINVSNIDNPEVILCAGPFTRIILWEDSDNYSKSASLKLVDTSEKKYKYPNKRSIQGIVNGMKLRHSPFRVQDTAYRGKMADKITTSSAHPELIERLVERLKAKDLYDRTEVTSNVTTIYLKREEV